MKQDATKSAPVTPDEVVRVKELPVDSVQRCTWKCFQCGHLTAELVELRGSLKVQRAGNVALCAVFVAAAEVCDCWDAAVSHSDAKSKLQTAVEAYRELVAPLGLGGADPEKPAVQP
jgi:hypothetical protein